MFNKAKNKFVLVACCIAAISYSQKDAFAAPSINTANGNIKNGQSVIVNGSGFGTKPQAAPIKFDDFEGGSNGSKLVSRDPSWHVYDGPGDGQGALYSNAFARSGSTSVGRHIANGEQFNTNYYTHPQPSDAMFISYWWRTANADNNDNTVIKMSRINSSTAAGGGGVYNGSGNTSLGGTYNLMNGGGPYCAFNNGTGMNELFFNTSDGSVARLAAPQMNKWVHVEMYKKLSTPGSTDGAIYVNILGADSASNYAAMTRAAGNNFRLDTVLLGLEDGSDQNHDYDVFIDDMYIDNTQARVEICNTPTWGARTECDTQRATAWSGTDITFTVNQGAIPTSSTRYLYVVDANGNANANGYPIKVDATSTLAPPIGLRINN